MATFKRVTISILFLLLLVPAISAKTKEKRNHTVNDSHVVIQHVDVFIKADRELIRHHYIKSRGSLPPGLERQLRRKGHLPPGLEKKLRPFPAELERRLPPLKPGLIRGFIGGNAVIVDKKTSIVLDIFAVF